MAKLEDHPLNPNGGVPLFIPAGVIKEPAQLEPFLRIKDPLSAPVLTFGGFSLERWPGNAKPGETDFIRYPREGKAGNARGLPNEGEEGILSLKRSIQLLSELGIKTALQVTNLPHEKPLDVVRRLVVTAASVKPTAIEFNLSCPNGKKADGTFHPPTYRDPETSGRIAEVAREELGPEVCFGIKDGPHVNSPQEEVDEDSVNDLIAATRSYIDFACGINTIANQEFPELTCGGGRGGMSGRIVAPVARQHLRIWRQKAPEIAYLSCGGVDSVNAAEEIPQRLKDGALLVGGVQEVYDAKNPMDVIASWSIKWASSLK